jgi:hypothetical protein
LQKKSNENQKKIEKKGKALEKGKGPAAALRPGYQNGPWPITSFPETAPIHPSSCR